LKHLLGEGDIFLRKEKVTYEPKRSIIYNSIQAFCQFLNFKSNLSNQSRKLSNLYINVQQIHEPNWSHLMNLETNESDSMTTYKFK